MKEEGEREGAKIHELFIDIGAASRREAEKLVRVGDPITLADSFELLRNDLAVARAFDNRIGTFAVAEALRLAREGQGKLQAEILAVSNIMEEVGLMGARQIAYTLKPDVALVVDVTHATDYPTVNQQQHGDVKVGRGPTLTHGVCNHPEVVARLETVARAQKIKLQHEATSGDERDGHGRDFLDAGRDTVRADQSARPLHAFAGGVGQFARPGTDSAADVRVRALAQGRGRI